MRDYGAVFMRYVGSWDRGIGICSAPPSPAPAARRPGGGLRGPLAESAAPRGQALEVRAVDNFPISRGLWIAAKSLISLLTYAHLTDLTSHDIHYVKSQPVPEPRFAAFMGNAMRETSICG